MDILLCKAAISVVVDTGDLVSGIDGDHWLLLLLDLGESRHFRLRGSNMLISKWHRIHD